MNVLITLPKELIDKILSGEKNAEMRKCLPKFMKIGEDGFFMVEKGTDDIRGWCRVDGYLKTVTNKDGTKIRSEGLGVTYPYIMAYAPPGTTVYLWKIGKVIKLDRMKRRSLMVDRNPQQFAYCPLSYGESW